MFVKGVLADATLGEVSLAAALTWFSDIPADATDRIRAATLPQALVIGGSRDYLTGIQPVVDYAAALGARLSRSKTAATIAHNSSSKAILMSG